MQQNNLLIKLEGVTYNYPGGPPVLNHLNFQFKRGDRIGLIAPNGSGKTTLLHLIMGLLKPSAGRIEIFGKRARDEKDFADVRRKIGLLFQDADDQLFSPTVLEDVAFGPLNLGKTRKEAIRIAKETLAFLGLEGFENRITFKLSGGEKRLVSLATVLAMAPEILLLDEPINGLDKTTQTKLAAILSGLDLSYLLISHDFDFLAETTDAIYTMQDGKILSDKELHIHQHVHAHEHGVYPHRHERTEDRRTGMADRRQSTEDRRQRSEVRGKKSGKR
jgi:cobalt/nickel transport system ATP-binding protein